MKVELNPKDVGMLVSALEVRMAQLERAIVKEDDAEVVAARKRQVAEFRNLQSRLLGQGEIK